MTNNLKFNIGDKITINDTYLKDGFAIFGKDLKHTKLKGVIIKATDCTGIIDSFNNPVRNIYDIKTKYNEVISLSEHFLKLSI